MKNRMKLRYFVLPVLFLTTIAQATPATPVVQPTQPQRTWGECAREFAVGYGSVIAGIFGIFAVAYGMNYLITKYNKKQKKETEKRNQEAAKKANNKDYKKEEPKRMSAAQRATIAARVKQWLGDIIVSLKAPTVEGISQRVNNFNTSGDPLAEAEADKVRRDREAQAKADAEKAKQTTK